jgi:tripartite-type tricarboxylate transporter receptor subunit TctC
MNTLLRLFLALGLVAVSFSPAHAQNYPTKPVRIIVPHPTGGGPVDGPARALADFLSKDFGQPFVVENRDGADGIIGVEALMKSAPDGYTLAVTSVSALTMNELTRLNLPFSTARDLAPVIFIGAIQSLLLVHPSVPAKTLRELIELAKAKPNTLSWGTLGATSNGPLFIGMFKKDFGASFYMIPYKNTIQALQGTVAGDVNVVAYAAGGAAGFVKSGKLRAIAYTGERRHRDFPDVPTFEEAGAKPTFLTWIGMFAPVGTPADIIRRVNAESAKALSDTAFAQKYLNTLGVETTELSHGSPEQFAQFIKADKQAYEVAVKAAGIEKR